MQPTKSKLVDPPGAAGQAADGETRARPPRDKPGVLVVDDEHLVRIMVQMGLERNGFDVWLASDGPEAIELYRKHRESISVVLLDVLMPGLDGPQTLAALRDLNPEVRACFMSGDTGAYEVEWLRQRGAACVVAKPFLLADLADILRQMIEGRAGGLLPPGGTCHV
jgi:CheY-like chemotaxis protein